MFSTLLDQSRTLGLDSTDYHDQLMQGTFVVAAAASAAAGAGVLIVIGHGNNTAFGHGDKYTWPSTRHRN